ncbi:MAG TPA: ATP-dependent metallopeptidase FtsH/Yme1/Tma family protein, partial [Acidimicrobiales bacterium]|nr:ATP-dependent metallopeptidase FtsH/Yme1/Tma family protein [Acidimicrobiales bacterium]
MSQQSPPPPPPPPSPGRSPRGSGLGGRDSLPRWTIWVLGGVVLAFLFLGPSLMTSTDRDEIDYSEMLTRVQQDEVSEITWNNNDGSITGKLDDGTEFSTNGPLEPAEDDRALFREHDVKLEFT